MSGKLCCHPFAFLPPHIGLGHGTAALVEDHRGPRRKLLVADGVAVGDLLLGGGSLGGDESWLVATLGFGLGCTLACAKGQAEHNHCPCPPGLGL